MFTDEQHSAIKQLLESKGAQGVNAICRELDGMPLSTVDKYLKKQTYFRQNEQRKWDLPERVNSDIQSNTMLLMVEQVESAIKVISSQLDEVKESVTTVQIPFNILKRAASVAKAPQPTHTVKTESIHPLWDELAKRLKDMPKLVKERIQTVPEEYRELLQNLDWFAFALREGQIKINNIFNDELAPLLIGDIIELPYETLQLIEKYQKGAEATQVQQAE